MNLPGPDQGKRKQATLIALVGAALLIGAVDASFGLPSAQDGLRLAITVFGNIVVLLIGFNWLRLDARELVIRRPLWLDICIVLFAAIFVPYYLYKTRPQPRRLPAIAAFFALVIACMLATAIGAALTLQMTGTAVKP
ncbi:MAG: hypothetical protein IT467_00340 [Dokdonella sp.]|nr:hypothetical protein [Dokdonella sp.]